LAAESPNQYNLGSDEAMTNEKIKEIREYWEDNHMVKPFRAALDIQYLLSQLEAKAAEWRERLEDANQE